MSVRSVLACLVKAADRTRFKHYGQSQDFTDSRDSERLWPWFSKLYFPLYLGFKGHDLKREKICGIYADLTRQGKIFVSFQKRGNVICGRCRYLFPLRRRGKNLFTPDLLDRRERRNAEGTSAVHRVNLVVYRSNFHNY